MAATWRAKIMDIPVEVLLDNILPFCEAEDVLSLGCTNKFFALVTTDEAFWRQKLAVDYNFTGSGTTRTSNWKIIYQRFRNPRVFVWGCVIFSFFYVMGGVNSFIDVPAYSSGITEQRGGLGSTWVVTVPRADLLWSCSFSGRTSPSRCPRGQPGNNLLVSKSHS